MIIMEKIISMFPIITENPELAAKYAVFAVVGIVFVLFAVCLYIANKKEKERIFALRQRAEERGLMFEEKTEIPAKAGDGVFFTKGHSYTRKAANKTVSVKAGHHSFDVFDYCYVTGSGKSRQVHQYACAFSELRKSSGKFYPIFCLEPENLFHKIADKFTHSDVDFEYYPHFSKIYYLTGPSKERIESFFKPAMLSCLESHPGLEIYSDGENMTICRKGHLNPEEMANFEAEAEEIIQLFAM